MSKLMWNKSSRDIVYVYAAIFHFLQYLSLFILVRAICRRIWFSVTYRKLRKSMPTELLREGQLSVLRNLAHREADKKFGSNFSSWWVVGHTVGSLVILLIVVNLNVSKFLTSIFLIYGVLRIFEIMVYQINALLFDSYKSSDYKIQGKTRIIILLLHNYVEIVFWFAVTYYSNIHIYFAGDNPEGITPIHNTFVQAMYISFVTMTTFGQANFEITNSLSQFHNYKAIWH
ncbi:hypothetical protein [Cohnella sp. 56]|uniref:hypothetical protein n=1 Tax=Cohnella sp. 56 TaxID=3113722 RepID=UPI0030EA4BD6